MSLTADQLVEIASLTTIHINDSFPDLLVRANALYQEMDKRKNYVPGGKEIQMPVFGLNELASQGFIAGTAADSLNLNKNQVVTYGTLQWKFFYYAVTFDLKELTQTEDSPHAVKSFVQTKVGFAKNSMIRTLSEALHASGSVDLNKFNGFADIFAASGTAYASLNDTDFANWAWYAPSAIAASNYTNIAPIIDTLVSRCSQTGANSTLDGTAADYRPKLILSDATQYSNFKKAEQLKLRFTPSELMKAGFTAINVDGLDWVVDTFCSSSTIYVLTPPSFELFYKYGFGKKSPLDTTALRVPQQPITSQINFLAGNLGCTNRRVNAKVTVS